MQLVQSTTTLATSNFPRVIPKMLLNDSIVLLKSGSMQVMRRPAVWQ
jgi:hypothetical protein